MKVLLIKDVYKLGHAGDVKKVAAGYGRNYLLPQGLAVLATSGALKQADRIREEGAVQRANLNQELSGLLEKLERLLGLLPSRVDSVQVEQWHAEFVGGRHGDRTRLGNFFVDQV